MGNKWVRIAIIVAVVLMVVRFRGSIPVAGPFISRAIGG